jgi:hypothetical protein
MARIPVSRRQKKVFCIGQNKTGTTSVATALSQLGYQMGEQSVAELFIEDWSRRDFRRIVAYCASADAFQDIPFSLDYTYQAVDAAYPRSKFILTVRSSGDQWYASLIRFHTTIVGKNRRPTAADLKEFSYRRPGWLWEAMRLVYGDAEELLYDRETYIRRYEEQNRRVLEYFRNRPDDLLVLNVADQDAMRRLCNFLGKKYDGSAMPHLNRS